MTYRKSAQWFLALASAVATAGAVAAQPAHEHHHHHQHGAVSEAAPATEAPPLEILMPGNDDIVGSQLAVVLQTPADLGAMTMSAAEIGVHLHLAVEGVSLMPTRQQLIDLGSNRYLFLFDLPAKPGRNTIKVYWADAAHRTMESTVKSVTVNVKP